MNTNTPEQAKRLKELGIKFDTALTLDELHRVFEVFYIWPKLSNLNTNDGKGKKVWTLQYFEDFPRTKNHAADWTDILIWLLENGHVTANKVNEVLK